MSDRWLLVGVLVSVLVVLVFAARTSYAEEDMGGGVVTGDASSKGDGESLAPGVEAVLSPAPQPLATEDLTVGVSAQQLLAGTWRALAWCESTLDPRAVSSNGLYYGLFQFDLPTWRSVGEVGNPINHSPAVQLAAAQRLQARRGWAPWPACSRRLGLR